MGIARQERGNGGAQDLRDLHQAVGRLALVHQRRFLEDMSQVIVD